MSEEIDQLQDDLQQLENRVENLEEAGKIKVRVVDTDNGQKIVLEDRQQTWFSPNYFRKILERIDEED